MLVHGALVPAATLLAALAGPAVLLVRPALNDVLDGVVFGAAAGAAAVGGGLVVIGVDLLPAGPTRAATGRR